MDKFGAPGDPVPSLIYGWIQLRTVLEGSRDIVQTVIAAEPDAAPSVEAQATGGSVIRGTIELD